MDMNTPHSTQNAIVSPPADLLDRMVRDVEKGRDRSRHATAAWMT